MKIPKSYNFIHIGQRETQQDAQYISQDQKLLIVCDGVGGNAGGQLASKTVVESISKSYCQLSSIVTKQTILKIVLDAQIELNKIASQNKWLEGLSTTIALAYIKPNKILTALSGDSRIIHMSLKTKKFKATKDHSIVRELRDANIIKSDEEMLTHPLKNRITKALRGSYKNVPHSQVEIQEIKKYNIKDLLLIATDGALESFTSKQIANHFMHGNLEERWKIFKNYCKQNSKDNNTSILRVL